MIPSTGQIVHVRSRKYLVEHVAPPPRPGDSTLLRLACVEDDAQGEALEVLWEKEVDARQVGATTWEAVAGRGFDEPRLFSAYMHAMRWNCVTSTNPNLLQSPYRAGIEVKAYQLEPLRKALLQPRVSLFIADDVGLGKTIEAGLILRELLMRQKVRRTVICCPPSVVRQWRDEMEQRFGLSFVIYDREYVAATRQQRGYGINPWTTHVRFIISHALIRNESYTAPLRDWLGDSADGSLLILDEAHNFAPSSGGKYAIDSKLTGAMRDLRPRFEHALFLSATPHNGHSNSFSALLEMLDPQKFCRGVPVHPKSRDAVMVRRLKGDLREIGEEFPDRKVVRIEIDDLPESAPELRLSVLLQRYRQAREERLKSATRSKQAAAMLVITSLQKRLLSSIEAFARTLHVHRKSVLKHLKDTEDQPAPQRDVSLSSLPLLAESPGADDVRSDLPEDEIGAEEDAQMASASSATLGPADDLATELELLDEMVGVAEHARHEQDERLRHLLNWIKEQQCPELGESGATWLDRRILIFTEYADTKRYLQQQLAEAVRGSDRADERILTFHGGIGEANREAIKTAFNADPSKHPVRILIATDAAREGVNLQNHCADLFHFDVPWNPSRLEQRNGRIDRKLQRAREVRCHYYVLPQRAEDRVLDVLVEKTENIRKQLGSLSPVVGRNIDELLKTGIRHDASTELVGTLQTIDKETGSVAKEHVIAEELEENRDRQVKLQTQVERLQKMLKTSKEWIRLDDRHFRDALSASLEMVGVETLKPLNPEKAAADPARARYVFPALHEREGADHSWGPTLDSLRVPIKRGQKPWEWRREAPIRPVVFKDPGTLDGDVVHLHLEHRIVQRLLGRFLSQGFLHDELTRACVVRTDDPIPKVLLLGRLSLYGEGAARLHDEVLAVAAEWKDPASRGRAKLKPLKADEQDGAWRQLEEAFALPRLREAPDSVVKMLKGHASRDVQELSKPLTEREQVATRAAERALTRRGEAEAKDMVELLEKLTERIKRQQAAVQDDTQLAFKFDSDEAARRQLRSEQAHWAKRLTELEREMQEEPARIREGYVVKASRLEPVGLAYLWPMSS